MKIYPNVTFLRNLAGPAPLIPKDTAVNKPALPAAADPERPVSLQVVLPSIDGGFDAARVAEIRASISAGRYQVNTEKIADGLLATVRDLLSTKTP
ncbi:MAG: flagellar biosynthesis anti-sigma factor FlgM [Burkholderiales bacterium RIFCSPHIGHO2_12_FULL_61_11]|nr:MAG: flagellar biosynthesis anti-sigma factor FlgM [Burkholderiales bacterium RIFCSPHIGHO2_12_FULL_61_11]